jgi:Holliday junction resolvase RusA-like endonuclease
VSVEVAVPELLCDVTIPGEPQRAPRPQVTAGGHVYYPGDYKVNRDSTAMLMLSARKRKVPCAGLVRLEALFVRGNRRRKDADNLLKLLMDAGNGVLWEDDSQIVEGTWLITFGQPPRTEFKAWSL